MPLSHSFSPTVFNDFVILIRFDEFVTPLIFFIISSDLSFLNSAPFPSYVLYKFISFCAFHYCLSSSLPIIIQAAANLPINCLQLLWTFSFSRFSFCLVKNYKNLNSRIDREWLNYRKGNLRSRNHQVTKTQTFRSNGSREHRREK